MAFSFKKFFPKEFPKLVPLLYIYLLVLGLVLTLAYAFVPKLVTCSGIFGQSFCTPTGIFLILFVSLPGYILAGNLLTFIGKLPWLLSLISVFVVSGTFYYLLGLFIEKIKAKKIRQESFIKMIVLSAFVILALLLFLLVGRR